MNDENKYTYSIITVLRTECRGTTSISEPRRIPRQGRSIQPDSETTASETFASTEARKIASTGFLPQIDITAEGTANLNHLDQWNSPKGDYRPYTYQALATLTQPLYTGGSLIAQKKVAQADEALAQLTTELALDQIHYQSDAVYWNASAARAGLKAAATFQDIVQQQYDIIQDRFDDGTISRTDLLMISTRRKEAELQYIKARQTIPLPCKN